MALIRWTPHAAERLSDICRYIAQDSTRYAGMFAQDILSSVDRLESFPLVGRKVPECDDETLREIIRGNYRIVYRVENESVVIITVYHCARLLADEEMAE